MVNGGSRFRPRRSVRRKYSRKPRSQKTFRSKVQNVILSTAEKKVLTTDVQLSNISSTMSSFSLTPISEGVNPNHREGNEVYPTYLTLHGYWRCNDNYNFMRLILVQWFPDTAISIPTAGEIFNSTLDQHSQMFGPLNTSKVNKVFRVLWTRRMMASDTTENPTINRLRTIDFNINLRKKLKYKKIIYNSTTVIDGRGKLYLLAVSDSTVTGHPDLSFVSKVSFRDP